MTMKRGLQLLAASFALFLVAGAGFFFGFSSGQRVPKTILVRGVKNVESPRTVDADFGTFWNVWQLIEQNYINDDKVKTEDKVYGAISGFVNSLGDPYTVFLSPDNSKKFEEDIRGNFGGIGAEIGIRKNQLVVIAPLKDTPASRAGLEAGDRILRINASSTEGFSLDQAIGIIRGPKGSLLTLSIMRDSWDKPKDIKIIRASITVPTLDFEIKEGNIAYVQLHSFNNSSNQLFYNAMLKALSSGTKGVVLDLRNNPGGFLGVAIDLAGWFLPRGDLVVSEAFRGGLKDEFRANGNSALASIPVVVVVNQGSASASEILAGALRADRGIKLVGEHTFGKGTVQEIKELPDGSSLKVTIAHWVLPDGKILDGEGTGLKPDYEVKISDDDVAAKKDPQLDKALQVIKTLTAS